MKTFAKVNIFILFVIILASCYKPVEFVSVEDLHFEAITPTNKHLTVSLNVYNPNFYTLKITHTDIDVYFNDSKIGEIKSDKLYNLPAKDTTNIEMEMDMNVMNILNTLFGLMQDSKELKFDGYLTAKTFLGSKNVRIEQSKNLNN